MTVASVLSRSVFNGKDPTVNTAVDMASIQEKLDQIKAEQKRIHDDMTAGFAQLKAQLADVRICVREGNHRLLSMLLEGKALLTAAQDRLATLIEQQGALSAEVSWLPARRRRNAGSA
jgi:ABC-type transporter MlaC component